MSFRSTWRLRVPTIILALGIAMLSALVLAPGRIAVFAIGTQLYVDAASGNDANNGLSPQSAWRTIQKAANSATQGDTVTVLPGTYNERVIISNPGADQAPITYQAQGTVYTKGFNVRANFITIRGFDITSNGTDFNNGWGIVLEASNCVIESNYIHHAIQGGIAIHAAVGSDYKASNNIVRGNRIYRNAQVGINVAGASNLVEGNEVWGTIQYHPDLANPPSWSDADGIRFFGSDHVLRGNYIHDISYSDPENVNPHIDCFQTWGDDYHSPARNVVIDSNVCVALESQAPNERGHGFMLAQSSGVVIRNNIILAAVMIETGDAGNDRLVAVNNTFGSDLSLSYTGGINLVGTPNSTVQNNIFYNFPDDYIGAFRVIGTSTSGLVAGNNLYFRSDGGGIRAPVYSGDVRGLDPRFVNTAARDLRLSQDSPAIDAGAALGSLLTLDHDGAARPQGAAFDMGAYEFGVSGPLPTATTQPTATPEPEPEPVVTDVRGKSGSAPGRTKVKVIGSGFDSGALVTVNGYDGVLTEVVTSYEIVSEVEADLPATVSITVTNPDGHSFTADGLALDAEGTRTYLPAIGSQ